MPPLLPWKGPDPIIVSRRPMMAEWMPANGSESTVTRPAVPPMISFSLISRCVTRTVAATISA